MALIQGQVVKVRGGKYDGQAAQVKRITDKAVEVQIMGRIVKLKRERVDYGE